MDPEAYAQLTDYPNINWREAPLADRERLSSELEKYLESPAGVALTEQDKGLVRQAIDGLVDESPGLDPILILMVISDEIRIEACG